MKPHKPRAGRPGRRSRPTSRGRDPFRARPKAQPERPESTPKPQGRRTEDRELPDWPEAPAGVQASAGRTPGLPEAERPFRVLIAIHRPRYRGRAERAARLPGWEVVSLLNKQDPVGQVARPPHPPDLLVLSGDFGRQRSYAIFRAVQPWRERGMKLIGLVEDCTTAPEGHPDSVPEKLCDLCLTPPYVAAELRRHLLDFYVALRGEAPPLPDDPVLEEEETSDDPDA